MSADVGLLVIHGIGAQKKGFADPFIEETNSRVEKAGFSSSQLAWETAYWADITEPTQRSYLKRANVSNDLDYIKLRQVVLSALGDASAYQKVPGEPAGSVYNQIHARIRSAISRLYESGLDGQPKPLIVCAHSLGGHIMSNYIWDMQRHPDKSLSPFERMEKLTGLITFGCNIPLFTFSHADPKPIKFPPKKLSPALLKKARWDNYFDPDDVLGYPLKPINEAYGKTVNSDIAINVGGWASSWQPQSHTKYWTDNDFTRPVARYICKFLS